MQVQNPLAVLTVDVGNTETSFGLFAAGVTADAEPLSSFTLRRQPISRQMKSGSACGKP